MGIMRSRTEPSELGDSELIQRSRSGDRDAFGELWRRHSRAGVTVARSYTSTFDPEDLVAESYAKIFQAIQSGGGPTGAFRPYLFTTIRNTAASWGRAKRETAIEDADQIEDPQFSEENTLAALDRSLTARAFQSLPTRWQEALWYSEVESMTPQEIAPLLGMKANGVAALTYRAREGLRQAWIQAHLSSLPADSECRWSIDHLGAYARDGLSKRDTARVDHHLSGCAKCTIVAAEAKEVGSRLTLVLLPLAAGLAGATGYTAWLQSGSHAAAYAMGAGGVVMPAAAVGGGALSGGAGGAGGSTAGGAGAAGSGVAGSGVAGSGVAASAATAGVSGVVIGSIVTGVLVAAAAVTAIVMAPMLFNNTPTAPHNEAAPPAATSVPSPDSTSTAPSTLPTAPPTVPAIPPADSAFANSSTNAPVSVLAGSPTTPPVTVPPAPPAAPSAPSIGDASVSPAGVLSIAGTGDPGNTVTATAQSIGGGGGGTARFAVVPSGIEVGSTTVTSSGTWTLTTDLSNRLPNGTYTFTVIQSGTAGDSAPTTTKPIKLNVLPPVPAAPRITSPDDGQSVKTGTGLSVTGVGGSGNQVTATLTLVGGESTATADTTVASDESWRLRISIDDLTNGEYTLSVTQSNEAGASPTTTRTIIIALPPATLAAPVIYPIDTGSLTGGSGTDGLFYPIVSGLAEPGATVTVLSAEGSVLATATADVSGEWATLPLTLDQPGSNITITANQQVGERVSDAAVSPPFSLNAPSITYPDDGDWIIYARSIPVSVSGKPGASVQITLDDGEEIITTLDASGAGTVSITMPPGVFRSHSLVVTYVDPTNPERRGLISAPLNFFVVISARVAPAAQ